MLGSLYGLARGALFTMEPEDAHEFTLRMLERGLYPRDTTGNPPELAANIFGLSFPNPIGIAAGYDKDARVPDAVLGLGCGFAEVGTLTPLPQPGNPRPRVFRLISDKGLINRLGFNNGGHAAALERLRARRPNGIVCVNVGANKDSVDRAQDYVRGIETFYEVATMFTVNISSPNTPGLRDLQAPAALDELIGRVMAARAALMAAGKPKRPIIVKIAPDIAEDDIGPITERLLAHAVDGIAVSNTTLSRHGLRDPKKTEAGGSSGRPAFHRSTVMLAKVYRATGGKIPLIGIGGIDSAETALAKIEAGASLLQLYTGLIYQGPGLIGDMKRGLALAVRRASARNLSELRGTRAAEWATKPFEI
ncbi:MAG: dihydroorotate dehydrogenase (quinone) [Hyphomicrobium sp.]|nr:dihydroorotate dehydrogenase (quinone) [Hyphomicrobium sp.]PPD06008.1 MAG: dihydroorotate dehydrogenase (quinone) [Hyphomicrobium sp.]